MDQREPLGEFTLDSQKKYVPILPKTVMAYFEQYSTYVISLMRFT